MTDAIRIWRLRPLLRPPGDGHVLLYNAEADWQDASAAYETGPSFSFVVPDSHFAHVARTDTARAALDGGVVVQQSHVERKYFQVPKGARRVRVRGVDGFVREFGRGGELRQVAWFLPIDATRGRVYASVDAVKHRSQAALITFLDRLPEA